MYFKKLFLLISLCGFPFFAWCAEVTKKIKISDEIAKDKWLEQFEERIAMSTLVLHDYDSDDDEATEMHPLLDYDYMDQLFGLAVQTKHYLTKKYPNEKLRIFSLGQSPAWLVAMMHAIDKRKGCTDIQYKHLAFSGHFYDFKDKKSTELVKSEQYPDHEQRKAYRKYLRKIGLHKPEGSRTFIVEFPNHCKGIRSFYDVAKKKLPNEKFNFLISPPNFNNLPPLCEQLPFIDKDTVDGLLWHLARTDKFDDRLVLNFKYPDWKDKNPLDFKPSASAQLLYEIMLSSLDQKMVNG